MAPSKFCGRPVPYFYVNSGVERQQRSCQRVDDAPRHGFASAHYGRAARTALTISHCDSHSLVSPQRNLIKRCIRAWCCASGYAKIGSWCAMRLRNPRSASMSSYNIVRPAATVKGKGRYGNTVCKCAFQMCWSWPAVNNLHQKANFNSAITLPVEPMGMPCLAYCSSRFSQFVKERSKPASQGQLLPYFSSRACEIALRTTISKIWSVEKNAPETSAFQTWLFVPIPRNMQCTAYFGGWAQIA